MTVTVGDRKHCCVNCSALDCKIIHQIKFVTFGQDVNSSSSSSSFGSVDKRTDTEYKVQDILFSIYHVDHLNILSNAQKQLQQHDEEQQEEEEIGVCSDCARVLSNLGKYYHEFNKLRQLDSFMSKKISELDSIIKAQSELIQKFSSQQQQTNSVVNNNSEHNLSHDNSQASNENNHNSIHESSSSSLESQNLNDNSNSSVNNNDSDIILSTLPIVKLDRLKPEEIAAVKVNIKKEDEDDNSEEGIAAVKVNIKKEDEDDNSEEEDPLQIKVDINHDDGPASPFSPTSSTASSESITTRTINKILNSSNVGPSGLRTPFEEELDQIESDNVHDEDEPLLLWSSYPKNTQFNAPLPQPKNLQANIYSQNNNNKNLQNNDSTDLLSGNKWTPNIYLGVRSTKFRCTACETDFPNISVFGSHLRSVHCPFPCGARHCHKIFATELERDEHMSKSGHQMTHSVGSRNKSSTVIPATAAKKPRLAVFNNMNTRLSSNNNKNNSEGRRVVNYRCPRCLVIFPTKLALVCHLPSHPGFKCALECPSCSRICTSIPAFIGHIEKTHRDHKLRRCTICKQSYPCVMTFDAHFRESHMRRASLASQGPEVAGSSQAGQIMKNIPTKCRQCSGGVRPILGRHTDCCNSKPILCSKCGKPVWRRVPSSSSSSQHVPRPPPPVQQINIDDDDDDDDADKDNVPLSQRVESHQCNICDKKFLHLCNLQAHQKTHK